VRAKVATYRATVIHKSSIFDVAFLFIKEMKYVPILGFGTDKINNGVIVVGYLDPDDPLSFHPRGSIAIPTLCLG